MNVKRAFAATVIAGATLAASAAPAAAVRYEGVTSQGMPISFDVGKRAVGNFRLGVRFDCTDNTFQYARGDTNDENIGPFPKFRINKRRKFGRVFEAPNETAIYYIRGAVRNGVASGTFRAVEGYDEESFRPDPDGGIICDTGWVTFQAPRR